MITAGAIGGRRWCCQPKGPAERTRVCRTGGTPSAQRGPMRAVGEGEEAGRSTTWVPAQPRRRGL